MSQPDVCKKKEEVDRQYHLYLVGAMKSPTTPPIPNQRLLSRFPSLNDADREHRLS
jgi:hypothetical protein